MDGTYSGDMTARTILVTGGAGFIGSNFVQHLMRRSQDDRVVVLDALTYAGHLNSIAPDLIASPRFEFWHGDVKNEGLVNQLVERSDVVVHLAAESHVARSIYSDRGFFETDVLGTQVVASAVARYGDRVERFIHISTSEVYGTAVEAPMDEGHPLNPTTPYASAKAGADRLVYSYWVTYGIPAIIVRPFNNYGPRQHLEKVIPRFITRAMHDNPLTIHGDGSASRDWVYVEDCCDALGRLLDVRAESVVGQVINIGTQRDTSVDQIARSILRLMGKSESLLTTVNDRPGQVDRHLGSYEKAKKLLGWAPTTDLDSGLGRTIEWYRANEEWWRSMEHMATVPVRMADGTIEHH